MGFRKISVEKIFDKNKHQNKGQQPEQKAEQQLFFGDPNISGSNYVDEQQDQKGRTNINTVISTNKKG